MDMSKPIKAGDLVAIIKPTPCCARSDSIGKHFIVAGFQTGLEICRYCHESRQATTVKISDSRLLVDLARVKRIPPLDELEGEKRNKEITA
jgi:hypothetical protein